jgi:hypothetical protein
VHLVGLAHVWTSYSVGQVSKLSPSNKLFLLYVRSHVEKSYRWLIVACVKDLNILSYVHVHMIHTSLSCKSRVCWTPFWKGSCDVTYWICTDATGPILLKLYGLNLPYEYIYFSKFYYVTCKQLGLGSVICKQYSYRPESNNLVRDETYEIEN